MWDCGLWVAVTGEAPIASKLWPTMVGCDLREDTWMRMKADADVDTGHHVGETWTSWCHVRQNYIGIAQRYF